MSGDVADHEPVSTFDWTAADSVSAAVIDAVAVASGKHQTETDPLYGTVDPDALDQLFGCGTARVVQSGLIVELGYGGMLVRLRGDGIGTVRERSDNGS